jgi:hypothetical protein
LAAAEPLVRWGVDAGDPATQSGGKAVTLEISPAAGSTLDVQPACRSFVWHGALMTVLGLLSGFTTMVAKAPTAALSAHTIGVIQGALLFGMAGAWPFLNASGRARSFIRISLLIGL